MEFFFKPKGIAIVGASANATKGGHVILNNVIKGFKGGVYPVNPRYSEISGIKCYPTVLQVPDPVDLAIIFVPAAFVPAVLQDCAQRGIRGAMIESGGFAESNEQGKQLQDSIIAIHEQTGIRIWGPNCMGLVDAVHGLVFSFLFPVIWEKGLDPGNVSLVVQSGMLSAGFLIDIMTNGVMGISKACSIGNKADVDECDILEYLISDADTGVIGLYLESIPNGQRFMELCRRTEKPIVVLRGGRSQKGAEAALSHTASLAGDGAVIKGALDQVGVVAAHDFRQLMDLCRTLAAYPEITPKNHNRIAILTMSGAAGIVSSDFMEEHDLTVAELSAGTTGALKEIFPEWMPVFNPVDLWPAVELHGTKKAYLKAFEAVCSDPKVDAILFHGFVGGDPFRPEMSILADMAGRNGKSIFGWVMGKRSEVHKLHIQAKEVGLPVYSELYRAVECMAAVLSRNEPPEHGGSGISLTETTDAEENLHNLLVDVRGTHDEYRSKQVLRSCNIPVVEERMVSSLSEAEEIANEFGFPVVLKGLLPGEIHKTELGLVRTGISSAEDIESALLEFQKTISGKESFLIQKQVQGHPELIAGLIRDPQFGPCVMCGFGGIFSEVLADRVFAVAPINHIEALALIKRLKTQKLLDGFRGFGAVDRNALADILVRIGELGLAYPQIQEIDINPLIVSNGKPIAVDATIVLS